MTGGTISEYPVRIFLLPPDSKPPSPTIPTRTLPVGEQIEVRSWQMVSGSLWLSVTLSDGTDGYISGLNRLEPHYEGELRQEQAFVRAEPNLESDVVAEYRKGARFTVVQTQEVQWKKWRKIRDQDGIEGYLLADIQPTGSVPQWSREQDAALNRLLTKAAKEAQKHIPRDRLYESNLLLLGSIGVLVAAGCCWLLGSRVQEHYPTGPMWIVGWTMSFIGGIVSAGCIGAIVLVLWSWIARIFFGSRS